MIKKIYIRTFTIEVVILLLVSLNYNPKSYSSKRDNSLKEKVDSIYDNKYPSVKIGTQEWMTENLNVDHFRNGDPIPDAKSDAEWKKAGDNKQPAWCYYDNDPSNEKIYGKLYNWYAVNDPRGLAPEGWHVPSDDEWTMLTAYLGGKEIKDKTESGKVFWYTQHVGGKMKSTGTQYWIKPNKDATNSSGFSGLPGGGRNSNGDFFYIGISGYWWSFSEDNTTNAWYRYLSFGYGNVNKYRDSKENGLSVRCLKGSTSMQYTNKLTNDDINMFNDSSTQVFTQNNKLENYVINLTTVEDLLKDFGDPNNLQTGKIGIFYFVGNKNSLKIKLGFSEPNDNLKKCGDLWNFIKGTYEFGIDVRFNCDFYGTEVGELIFTKGVLTNLYLINDDAKK